MDLVILAAGMGSRFGGLKQIEPIDEYNNFIIDYSIYDAKKAGFDKVIFIIKEENYDIFKETIGKRVEKRIETHYCFQKLENIPSGYKLCKTFAKPSKSLIGQFSILSSDSTIILATIFFILSEMIGGKSWNRFFSTIPSLTKSSYTF